LPLPPGPVSVNSLLDASTPSRSSSSRSRPTKLLACAGRSTRGRVRCCPFWRSATTI
jgi:hypothetical protein